MVADGRNVTTGAPVIEGAKVTATAVASGKGDKVIVFKYKPKVRYRRKNGHRQLYTRLTIDGITAPGMVEPEPKAKPKPRAKPKAKAKTTVKAEVTKAEVATKPKATTPVKAEVIETETKAKPKAKAKAVAKAETAKAEAVDTKTATKPKAATRPRRKKKEETADGA
jgi:large subunit ribosomal protein L21